ncbi:hypothetical protein DFJ74DRAFT_647772 [Hyaloraphidium curvatum]|nr:hypothetical protein DFJ74DRAFT_647772 [Hyaloraphidium curvatum]
MEPHVAAFAEDEEESGSPEAEEDASDMDGSDASSSSDALSSTLLNVPTTDAEFSAALGAFLRTFPGSPLRPAIVELPGGGTLRGVVAERALAPGECVLRVPWAFVITAQKAAESWGMTDFEPALSEHQALALFLCYERRSANVQSGSRTSTPCQKTIPAFLRRGHLRLCCRPVQRRLTSGALYC